MLIYANKMGCATLRNEMEAGAFNKCVGQQLHLHVGGSVRPVGRSTWNFSEFATRLKRRQQTVDYDTGTIKCSCNIKYR